MKTYVRLMGCMVLSLVLAVSAMAQESTLITNARIFDGISEKLIQGQDVLVEDGMISKIGAGIAGPDGVEVIDAGGRVMTPGFIYMHEHIMMQASGPELLVADDRYIAILASRTARQYLERGITTIRDATFQILPRCA